MGDAPEGTKAWRKGWRKRWREESSFRGLSPLAKVIVFWVEENANDQGRVVTTTRHLAKMAGGKHYRHKVSRMAAWRAVQEACECKLLNTEAGQGALQDSLHPPTIITRLNYKDYQETIEQPVTAPVTALSEEAGQSSRRRQKKKKEDPQLAALVDGMKAAYQTHRGEVLDIQKAGWGDLAAVRGVLADDGEVLRRYTLFVADKYWPIKSMNAFRKAFQHSKFLPPKPTLYSLPGIMEFK